MQVIDSEYPEVTISQADRIISSTISQLSKKQSQGIFLHGEPGIGKSALIKQLAEKTNRRLIDIRLPLLDPVDLRGLPTIDEVRNIAKWLPPDFLPQEDDPENEHFDGGILLLDEINAAPPSIQACAYQLILDRRVGTYSLPENWIVIAAGNLITDGAVAYNLPTALSNRFTHLKIKTSFDEWKIWAWKNNIDPVIISFLELHSDALNRFDSKLKVFPTPRSWEFVSNFKELRDIDHHLYINALYGTIGKGTAREFLAFYEFKDEIPDINNIVEGLSYDSSNLKQLDVLYYIMGAIIAKLLEKPTKKRISNVLMFVNEFSQGALKDFSVVFVKNMITAFKARDSKVKGNYNKLINHPDFIKWLSSNKELLIY